MSNKKDRLDAIEKKLAYKFTNKSLLENAFIHSSFFQDRKQKYGCDNERLEFLGDSVLNLIVNTYLYKVCSKEKEGVLTQFKEQIVDTLSLKQYTEMLEVTQYMLMGKGEGKNLDQSSITADLFEAIIGAIYLDSSFEQVQNFFMNHFETVIRQKISSPKRNWKKELQEAVQKKYQDLPEYTIEDELGHPHKKTFTVFVWVMGKMVGQGQGSSKKEAEMQAARDAIESQEKREWQ